MTEQQIRQNERERIANLIEKGRFAPVSYYGNCLECESWTPPNHSDRWGHFDTCSWTRKEFTGDEYLANIIRDIGDDEDEPV